MRLGHAQFGGFSIEQIGGDNVGRRTDPVESAPGEHLDGPRFLGGGAVFEEFQIMAVHGFGADMGDDIVERQRMVRAL